MEQAHESAEVRVTENEYQGGTVRVDSERFRLFMAVCGASNGAIAKATEFSPSYVSEVRNGKRQRVSRAFLARAAAYLGARMSEPGVLIQSLLADWRA